MQLASQPAFRLPVTGRVVATESGADPLDNHHVEPSVPNQAKAYDLLGIDGQGRFTTGSGARVEDYVGWGMPIVAAAPGRVVAAEDGLRDLAVGEPPHSDEHAYGNCVAIAHEDGSFTLYGHMQCGSVDRSLLGAQIAAGTVLGRMGNSGRSDAPHLHVQRQLGSAEFFGDATAADLAFEGARLVGSYRFDPDVGFVDWREVDVVPRDPRIARRGDVLKPA